MSRGHKFRVQGAREPEVNATERLDLYGEFTGVGTVTVSDRVDPGPERPMVRSLGSNDNDGDGVNGRELPQRNVLLTHALLLREVTTRSHSLKGDARIYRRAATYRCGSLAFALAW